MSVKAGDSVGPVHAKLDVIFANLGGIAFLQPGMTVHFVVSRDGAVEEEQGAGSGRAAHCVF